MADQFVCRTATIEDKAGIRRFLSGKILIHRHLDWRQPDEWLPSGRFYLCIKNEEIEAMLCIAPENENINWVRIFAIQDKANIFSVWNQLFQKSVANSINYSNKEFILSLAYHPWMDELLSIEGWKEIDRIVQFEWDKEFLFLPVEIQPAALIRKMKASDLEKVYMLDCACFNEIWQQSLATITASFEQSGYSTVYEDQGEILGFQLSTINKNFTHLARIAVHPNHRRKHIGQLLIQDLFRHGYQGRKTRFTVNTQTSNAQSIALYKKLGFKEKGETIPIYSLE